MNQTPVKEIPSTVTVVDCDTGKQTVRPQAWKLMPPQKHLCQICAGDHKPQEPHVQGSMYYQIAFNGIIGRTPTWADAMAHCSDAVRKAWTAELKRRGYWSEPPNGERPIAHHGLDG